VELETMKEKKTRPNFDEWQVTFEYVWKGCAKDTN
jgi:hypothetical protein